MAALSDYEKPTLSDLNKRGEAAKFYNANVQDREPYLVRARRVSELTIPTLFRPIGDNSTADTIIPWNSIGAYCVSNLASKVVFSLFPAGRPNFKAEQDKRTAADLSQLDPDQRQHIEAVIREGLSHLEQEVASAIEEDGDRARMFVCALRLLIGGNHAFQFYDDGTIRGIPLERYVTVRDPQGKLLEWAIEDCLDWKTLPLDILKRLEESEIEEPEVPDNGKRPVKIYTHGELKVKPPYAKRVWEVEQSVCGIELEDTEAIYNEDALPYLFLPWLLLDEENYGRSYVEFYEGDLLTAESFTKTIGEGAMAMARFLTMVNPTGLTDKKMIAKAKTGDVISGREQDVSVLTAQGKTADFSIASQELNNAVTRLSRAFLLNSSIQRSGERVTAEEIRYVAQELEDALGGVYSQQVLTWQAPYIRLKLKYLQKHRRVTPLPQGSIKITVTAGLAALARNAELDALTQGLTVVEQLLGPDAVSQEMSRSELISRIFASLGIDVTNLILTPEQKQAVAQQAQAQMLLEKLGPEGLRQIGQNVTSNQVAQTNSAAKIATAKGPAQGAPQE